MGKILFLNNNNKSETGIINKKLSILLITSISTLTFWTSLKWI